MKTVTRVTEKIDSDYGDVLRLNCPCGKEISLDDNYSTCEFCGRQYQVVRTVDVYEIMEV